MVTGASSGLGARWAHVLAAAGAQDVLPARREAELHAVAAGIPCSLALAGDITSDVLRHWLIDKTLHRSARSTCWSTAREPP